MEEQALNTVIPGVAAQGEQGSPTSSTRFANNNFKQKQQGNTLQQYRQFESHRQTTLHQQNLQQSANNIIVNQGSNNPENIDTQRQIPITTQSPSSNHQPPNLQRQNSKGGFSSQSVFNHQQSATKQNSIMNYNLNQSGTQNQNQSYQQSRSKAPSNFRDSSSNVSKLKRKMTIFHIRKGMDDLRQLIQSSSIHTNDGASGGGVQNINGRVTYNKSSSNTVKFDVPYALQISPLISNAYDSPLVNSAQLRKNHQNNVYNYMPFSFIYGKLDSLNNDNITLVFANNKAKSDYSIYDSAKFDDFLKRSKISSALIKNSDSSVNSLKKIILINYQQMLEENKLKSQIFNSNSPDIKRNGQATLVENLQGVYNSGYLKTSIHGQRNSMIQFKSMNAKENKEKETVGHSVLVEIQGKKVVMKFVILSNDDLYLYFNDDGFEKFLLEKKKKATCDQLINIIDLMINRFQTIQSMLLEYIPASKKEILMETFLATNYAQNAQNSIREQLQYSIDIINKKIITSDILAKVKEMVDRKYKMVPVLIDEDIPNECKKILNDPYHLLRTLTNIIENSIQNTEDGFVQILLHQSRIFKEHLRFDIIDSGKGIDPDIVQLINDSNFFNEEEEEDAMNRLFLLFSSSQQKNNASTAEDSNQKNFSAFDSIIKGFGLKFSHHLIKYIGPYNRMYAESIPGIGSRISFVIYKEGTPAQDAMFKPYQFKNNNFEQEMEYFNPLNKNPSNTNNCTLEEYIEYVLNIHIKQEPPSLNSSLLNINHPTESKSFNSPFTTKNSKKYNNNRETRSTSAHQIKSQKNKVSFCKVKSQKNINDLRKNNLINKQLSPLISGTSAANVVQYNIARPLRLSQSKSPQNILNVPNDIYVENISQMIRNINPTLSQMDSENMATNVLNNTQQSSVGMKRAIQSKYSPKENMSQHFHNMRKMNSNPINFSYYAHESNANALSALSSVNNSHQYINPYQQQSDNSLSNISSHLHFQQNGQNLQNQNWNTSYSQMNQHFDQIGHQQFPVQQDKFLFDLNYDAPSNTQQILNESFTQQHDQNGLQNSKKKVH